MARRPGGRTRQGKQCTIVGCVNTRWEGDSLESGGFMPTSPAINSSSLLQSERRTIPHQRRYTCGKRCNIRGCVNTRWKEGEDESRGLIRPSLELSSSTSIASSESKIIPHARRHGCGRQCRIRGCVNTRWKETEDEFGGLIQPRLQQSSNNALPGRETIPHAQRPGCGRQCRIRGCVNSRRKETEEEVGGLIQPSLEQSRSIKPLEKGTIRSHVQRPGCGQRCTIRGCVNTRRKETEEEFGGLIQPSLEQNRSIPSLEKSIQKGTIIPHVRRPGCRTRTKATRQRRANHRGGPGNRRGRGRGHGRGRSRGRGRGRGSPFGQGNGLDVLDSLESSFDSGSLSFD